MAIAKKCCCKKVSVAANPGVANGTPVVEMSHPSSEPVGWALGEAYTSHTPGEYPITCCRIDFFSSVEAAQAAIRDRFEQYTKETGPEMNSLDLGVAFKRGETRIDGMFGFNECVGDGPVSISWTITQVPAEF